MIDHEQRIHSARSAPPRLAGQAQRRRPAAWLSGLCTALALLAAARPAAADDMAAPLDDQPQPELSPDAPPPGVAIAPGLTLSGYATGQLLAPFGTTRQAPDPRIVDNPQFSQRPRFDLSHLSGIVWWQPSPAWKVLGEVDVQDALQLPGPASANTPVTIPAQTTGQQAGIGSTLGNAHGQAQSPPAGQYRYGAASSAYVSLERLYIDYRASDSVSVRVGKFLTPIGRWNQDHSDPQTWTVLRPLISQSAFPTNVTGLMGFGSTPVAGQWVDYQIYASDGGEWRPSPWTHPFNSAIGARLSTSLDPTLQVGVSASKFVERQDRSNEFLLTGLDAVWQWHRAEISAEAVQRHSTNWGGNGEHGWFVQAVLPVAARWWLSARIEAYRRTFDPDTTRSDLIGIVYKSGAHWVFKAEWVRPSSQSYGLPGGLLSSVTLAF